MLGAFLRIVGPVTAIGGAFNLVGVVRNISYDSSEFAALTELASSLGLFDLLDRRVSQPNSGIKVTEADLRNRLLEEVLKREVIEGDRATAAQRMVSRATRKRRNRSATEALSSDVAPAGPREV